MAHLTLQLGGPIVVPLSIHFGSRKRRGVPSWKVRSLPEASAIDAGSPVQWIPFQRRLALSARPYLVALDGDVLDRIEA